MSQQTNATCAVRGRYFILYQKRQYRYVLSFFWIISNSVPAQSGLFHTKVFSCKVWWSSSLVRYWVSKMMRSTSHVSGTLLSNGSTCVSSSCSTFFLTAWELVYRVIPRYERPHWWYVVVPQVILHPVLTVFWTLYGMFFCTPVKQMFFESVIQRRHDKILQSKQTFLER